MWYDSAAVDHWIRDRFTINCNWTTGNCYLFAVMLKSAFPGGDIIYEPINGHFLYQLGNVCYDFYGPHAIPDTYYIWKQYKQIDPVHWLRIMRDCVGGAWENVFLDEEEANS